MLLNLGISYYLLSIFETQQISHTSDNTLHANMIYIAMPVCHVVLHDIEVLHQPAVWLPWGPLHHVLCILWPPQAAYLPAHTYTMYSAYSGRHRLRTSMHTHTHTHRTLHTLAAIGCATTPYTPGILHTQPSTSCTPPYIHTLPSAYSGCQKRSNNIYSLRKTGNVK